MPCSTGGDLWSKSKQRGLAKVRGRQKVQTSEIFPWLWRPDYTRVEPMKAPRDVRECLPRKGTREDTCPLGMICDCIDTPVMAHLQVSIASARICATGSGPASYCP